MMVMKKMKEMKMSKKTSPLHLNYTIITQLIEEGSKVLDLGCGNGILLKKLVDEKHVIGKGLEINQEQVIKSIQKGLCTIQSDIDEGLEFQDKEWDYVVLNQTLQSVEKPEFVMDEMLRIGKKVIVSFPNFAYWRVRFDLLFNGKMPKTKNLPFEWHNTPNIHLLTLKDFYEFSEIKNIKILKSIYLTRGKVFKNPFKKLFTNFFAEELIFIVSRD